MSKPLSRSDSRGILDDSSESSSAELEKQANKKTANPPVGGTSSSGVPSTSSRPLKRTGTWTMASMPKDKAEESSDPTVSPRKDLTKKPSVTPSSSKNPKTPPSTSHQTSAPTNSTSSTPPVSNKVMSDNRVYATDLSEKVRAMVNASLQSEGGLAPERLGEVLVAVESKGGKIKLAGDGINRILRGALTIRDFEPASGAAKTDFNVIKGICEPFMFRHLGTPELEKGRKKFVAEFSRVADKFKALADEVPQKQWTKSSKIKELMDPIMEPVIGLICGKGNSLDTSELPDQIKKALLSIDKHVIAWFGENGTGKPADMLAARKSALIGFLSTRSLGYVWLTKSQSEQAIDAGHLTRLMSYMNSYVSTQIDMFVTDVLLKQPDQPVQARKYIEVMTNKAVLKSKPSVPGLSLGQVGQSGRGIFSPRLTVLPGVQGNSTSDKTHVEKSAQKLAQAALMKISLERARFIDKVVKDAGLDKIDYPCYQYVKEIVVKMSKRGFDHFKKDPIKSFKKYADKYYAKPENHKKVKDGIPIKVSNALDALRLKMIGNPFAEDGDDQINDLPSARENDRNSEAEKSSDTEPSDETEVETESSEEASRS